MEYKSTRAIFDRVKEVTSDTWITPKYLTRALGEFDLDPCEDLDMPYRHAKNGFTIKDDGVRQKWCGRVWLNPPYSKIKRFMQKLVAHGNGIAFIYTRVETRWFFDYVWDKADAIFFFRGRIKCRRKVGEFAPTGGPPASHCLVCYGLSNVESVRNSGLDGKLIIL